MKLKNWLLFAFFAMVLVRTNEISCISLERSIYYNQFPERASTIYKIKRFVELEKWNDLGKELGNNSKKNLHQLGELARRNGFRILGRIVKAAQNLPKNNSSLHVPLNKFLQAAIFLEAELPIYLEGKQHFLSRRLTDLPYAVEYNAKTKERYIFLEDNRTGEKGSVSKVLLYDPDHPRFFLRAETEDVEKELKVNSLVKDIPGVVKARTFPRLNSSQNSYKNVFYPHYNQGSLQSIFDRRVRLTNREKMEIALQILNGLEGLHSKGIVHGAIKSGSCLVNVSKAPNLNRRKIDVAIGDLGKVKYFPKSLEEANDIMKKKEFRGNYSEDVFAVGSTFYQLFYGRQAPWLYRKKTSSIQSKKLSSIINRYTWHRRNKLRQMDSATKLSPMQEFEKMILNMVHPESSRRKSAKQLKEKMQLIMQRHS